jgi:uncharacterized protein YjbJ (UPF0337 family)
MKSSTQDGAEGKWHKVKGKTKEIAGKVSMNPDLEAEGKDESKTGKVQEKKTSTAIKTFWRPSALERRQTCFGPYLWFF